MFDTMRCMTDWFTDELFAESFDPSLSGGFGVKTETVIFPFSRCYCDVERLIDDPLTAEGHGIIYDFGIQLSIEDICRRMYLYSQHRSKLLNALCNDALLLDCHSFPVASEYDICIGFNEDRTKPDSVLTDIIIKYFETEGLKVGINTPYSNSITVDSPANYTSVMIELNQRLYLDLETKQKTGSFQDIKLILRGLYRRLAGNAELAGRTGPL
jgi:N-formylglutamate amidohydrolase